MYRIDEVISRLFSAFMTPVLNVMLISLVLSSSLAPHASLGSLLPNIDDVGLAGYTLGAVKILFSSKADVLEDILKSNGANIVNWSGRVAIIVVIVFSVAIYLLDQALYFLGWLAPFHLDFDFAAYARAQRQAPRLKKLYHVLKSKMPLREAHGVLSMYLGASNSDPARLKQRDALRKTIANAYVYLCYARAYILLTLFLLLYALALGGFKPLAALAWLIVAVLVFALCVVRYSHAYQRLVEFDVDCFIWARHYDAAHGKFVNLGEADTGFLADGRRPSLIDDWLARLCLRSPPSGYWRALQALFGVRPRAGEPEDDTLPT